MERTEHFLFLSSKDSLSSHPANKPHDFTVALPYRVRLEGGDWSCALLQGSFCMTTPGATCKILVFLCDLVQQSYIRDKFLPVLDMAHQEKKKRTPNQLFEIANPLYHPITRNYIDSIRVWIKDEGTLEACTDLKEPVRCILHLKKQS